eukprot:TRINITY_DN5834_c0_g1_i1.p2 TRINITY_DN5834_c0_g1~~TRINITY_DN5834_c0_g1_i1.p2  ORF type:complete len:428 (-),score=92.07 TRINITY_DN5834_c0_g1_i1:775-2058(-)
MAASTVNVPVIQVEPHVLPDQKMLATEWQGKKIIKVAEKPRPTITNSRDVILHVTATAICGSDLHLYHNCVSGMEYGDVLGHEFMGTVEEIGPDVANVFKKGERVVAAFCIACGDCFYCKKQLFSACDGTNPPSKENKEAEKMYGHRPGGFFGYSHLTGGYWGGQAEFVRVPFADCNLLKVPPGFSDEQVVFLSDIFPTAWHANELAEVSKGECVAIWGAGPVGLLAAQCAFFRKAAKVILIDEFDYRLDFAMKKLMNGLPEGSTSLATINFKKVKVKDALVELVGKNGVDCGIDAVGVHYCHTAVHTTQMVVGAETDPPEVLNEMIMCVRKGGRLGVVGAYVGLTNQFDIGGFMEKGQSMRAGQTPVQKYWHFLLEKIVSGEMNPSIVITHEFPLDRASQGYYLFDRKEDGCIKVLLKPTLVSPAA